jgi:hypothetical protein
MWTISEKKEMVRDKKIYLENFITFCKVKMGEQYEKGGGG